MNDNIIGATCLETNKRMTLIYDEGELWRISLVTSNSRGYDVVVTDGIILYHCAKVASKEIITSIYAIETPIWRYLCG